MKVKIKKKFNQIILLIFSLGKYFLLDVFCFTITSIHLHINRRMNIKICVRYDTDRERASRIKSTKKKKLTN